MRIRPKAQPPYAWGILFVIAPMLLVGCAVLQPSPHAWEPMTSHLENEEGGDADGGTWPASEPALVLTGPILKAASVAVLDLASQSEQLLREHPDVLDPVHQCLARVENYQISVWEGVDRYFVRVLPRIGGCIEGGDALKGGGANYEMSKRDFRILRRDYME
jgi:hypothetical protein